jgi:hydroxymethylglutaryl-CoA lyase
VTTALDCGVTHFDTALDGLGGCPFVPEAAGNISTEETVQMLSEKNIQTGIDADALRRCTELLRARLTESEPAESGVDNRPFPPLK